MSFTIAATFALVTILTTMIPAGPAKASRATGDPLAPLAGALLGAHVQDAAGNVGQQAVTALESLIGRTLAIDHYYRPWTATFPTDREQWNFDHGRIPMISWGKASTAEIVAGVHDDLIRQRSAAVAALGRPLFLRWFWEMDGHNNGNGGYFSVTPAEYIPAWRHIHDIFAAQGATNAVWVWCPNAWNFETGSSQQYYPGDAYVDWICADGYNWFPTRPGANDQSFQRIFQAFYDWAGPQGKPLMVGEWGALEADGTHKAAWLQEARATLKSTFPKIKAVVYFNHEGLPHEAAGIDWRVETSATALQAFVDMAKDPYFNPPVGGGEPPPAPPPVIPEVPSPPVLPLSAVALLLAVGLLRRRPGARGCPPTGWKPAL